MQKVSLRKLSILGLVLMAASAVTAAVVPVTKDKDYTPGSLTTSTRNGSETPGLTCELDTVGEDEFITAPCNITTITGSTGVVGNPTSDNNNNSTAGALGVDFDS